MSIKSKLLKHLSGANFEPYYWQELSEKELTNVKTNIALGTLTALALTAFTLVAKHEIKNIPEGCIPILFPEQAFVEQPKHCKPQNRSRILPAPLL